jgi:hypothetical protein
MSDRTSAQCKLSRAAAAGYIAAMSGNLALIARNHGLDTLGYLLDMAQLEADNLTRQSDGDCDT